MSSDFVLVDTGIEGTPEIARAIAECVGNSTKSGGLLRTKCLFNLTPVLKEIGYMPETLFHRVPSIFYSQCVRQAKKVAGA